MQGFGLCPKGALSFSPGLPLWATLGRDLPRVAEAATLGWRTEPLRGSFEHTRFIACLKR